MTARQKPGPFLSVRSWKELFPTDRLIVEREQCCRQGRDRIGIGTSFGPECQIKAGQRSQRDGRHHGE